MPEPPAVLFETARLRCRRWMPGDLEALFAVYADPQGMRFVGNGQPITRDQCAEWLRVTQENYARRGYGMFALELRATGVRCAGGDVVGFCGLVHPGGQPEPEIKYAFGRKHWGQGLASEVVPALLAHGAAAFGLPRIIATVAPGNLASQRVLTKAGLSQHARRENEGGSTTLVFEWIAPAPARRPGP